MSTEDVPAGCGRQVLLVEDDQFLAALVADILTRGGYVVDVAHDAAEGLELARAEDPDLLLTDVLLGPGPTGLDLAFSLHQQMPWVALVLITSVKDLDVAGLGAPPAGAQVIRKDQLSETAVLLRAVDAALRGETVIVRDGVASRPFANLTKAQVMVLRMVAQGLSNESIALRRKCSKSAVEQLLSSTYRGLGIRTGAGLNERAEAARVFVEAVGYVPRRD